ncbi:PREDICTED: probable leucine-rich repeat receptor-like protein kinase At2g28990 isoform X2 [Camelina sativa]|uniref:Probable leucine-rich repeat receptor-like protein kinase At2g28990 isoform X2 n=1 Tax=Camelina sativa TaxID=90675 RepID=A0ABM0Z537_CAMSA|nr:PREDICTED: probable leucine-rich repeat receptor-like protein kinase At2g28990 isoform X2 [Camelina sativa]
MKCHLLLALIGAFAVMVVAQKQEGFISLDCGFPIEESPYSDPSTGLTFTSDSTFIQTGKSARIERQLNQNFRKPYLTLRYFPEGTRNCYSLNVNRGTNYLISLTFIYGNYDDLNVYPNFDLYLGPDKWRRIDMEGRSNGTKEEIIHIPRKNSLDICLVRTGTTSPIISAIELRPLRNDTYVTHSGSLRRSFRVYLSNSEREVRFADDMYDRIWTPFFSSRYTQITTNLNINTSDTFEVPKAALSSAAMPRNASAPLIITWKPIPTDAEVYLYLHFAEIQTLGANETREFDIIMKGIFNQSGITLPKFERLTVFSAVPLQCGLDGCRLELVRTPKSTLPPLINALEAYTIIEFPQLETNSSDVVAIKNIKATYRLSKISWQGDPCLPQELSWENLGCSYANISTPPRIISLDLSNNSLTGPVPKFLANIKSLSLINLSGNNLTGSVPQNLLDREKEGLVLKLEGNPALCKISSCNPKDKKELLVLVIAPIASVLIAIVVVGLFVIFREKVPLDVHAPPSLPVADVGHSKHSEPSFFSKKIRFTYFEVQEMTNNFKRVLGEGGFGVVYHGCVNDTQQVAVKLLSPSSSQGYKHFKAEVELLMRVHHINLVSLVGYCDEGDHLALIYEYMPNGDLKQHLSRKHGGSVLSWKSRLGVAVDAALGLEYLHTGCKPPMVHRDIKSTNILLNESFQGKLADFGLSRSFPMANETQVSTVVAGTPGYLDPEYYQTNWLTEKSDVYSFGIVLLELTTNSPIIQQSREKPHIVEWVGFIVRTGDIGNIIDPNLHEDYDVGSVWKVIELAMSCVDISSARRPTMSQVVNDLKECVISENSRTGESQEMNSMSSIEFSMDMDTKVIPKAR